MIWQILVHFLFRLSFGLALSMLITSPRQVTAGFFRVHLWVALGLSTFAAVMAVMAPTFPDRKWIASIAAVAALLSYIGAVVWLYERINLGRGLLAAVALTSLMGDVTLLQATGAFRAVTTPGGGVLSVVDGLTAGVLLGTTFTAMLLGHWYLNSPSMKLAPLQKLVMLMAVAVILRGLVSCGQLTVVSELLRAHESTQLALLALRWLAGLVGVMAMAAMTWQTLKIPNTQSATGILYVAVIFAFLGELTAQLVTASGSALPA